MEVDGARTSPRVRVPGFLSAHDEFLWNALAHIANIEDHHPDLEVGYNPYCRVQFTTHAIKGLFENDFICAAKIDQIPLS